MYYSHLAGKRDVLHCHQCITDNGQETMYYRQCIAEFDEVGAMFEDAHCRHGLALSTTTCVRQCIRDNVHATMYYRQCITDNVFQTRCAPLHVSEHTKCVVIALCIHAREKE